MLKGDIMRIQIVFGMLLIGAISTCYGVDLTGISDSNGVFSIAIDPAITEDEYVAASVATNLAASAIVRLAAIQTLAKYPTPYLNILCELSRDPELAIPFAAAEALASCSPADSTATAKRIIQQLTTTPPVRQGDNLFGLRAAALLAELNDPSGFEYVAYRLLHAKFAAEKAAALAYLPKFRVFPGIPAAQAILDYIKGTIPSLRQEGTEAYKEAIILLPKAFHALYRLQSIDTLPQLEEFKLILPDNLQQNLQYYIQGLEAFQNNPPLP
jgi:hypothetical protein